jgi:uncharacterized damage-inducible protein DinB
MNSYLHELYAHQEWADAEHWRAFAEHDGALGDKAICERLMHIHLVQRGFLWVTGPRTSDFTFKKLQDFPQITGLRDYAREYHAEMAKRLKEITEARLEESVEVPWFKPPLNISVRHALTQAAMHSHYHRGQNATRLRELGGAPPGTDFIVWLRDGQPGAKWE